LLRCEISINDSPMPSNSFMASAEPSITDDGRMQGPALKLCTLFIIQNYGCFSVFCLI
jgi:hypothetical protein